MKEEELEVTKEKTSKALIFMLKGRVNSFSAEELQHYLEKALNDGEKNIVLDMLKVEYLSSAGIRVILKIYKDIKEAGGKFGIESPAESVRNVLGMTALDEMLIN